MGIGSLLIRASKPDSKVAELLRRGGAEIVLFPDGYSEVYLPSSRVSVCRKTTYSFLSAIEDKTLFVEATEGAESERLTIFVVEGDPLQAARAFHPNAVRGAMTSLLVQYGASLVTTASPEETAELILMIAKQEQQGIPEVSLHPKRRALDLPDTQRRVVEMLPGAGLVVARELLRHFGTIQRIASASAEQLAQVKGVGKGRAESIRDVLQEPYKDVDTEKEIEDALEKDPSLLFAEPVEFLARQHRLTLEDGSQGIVDLIFRARKKALLYVVEVKKGPVTLMDYRQIKAYIQAAGNSELIKKHLQTGCALRGVLASTTQSNFRPPGESIEVRTIDRNRVLEVLEES